jgi:hypothetical protein
MESKQCFIMGLPNAGKTTYLTALWHSLLSSTKKNKFKLDTIGEKENNYLSNLSLKWVNAEKLDRTLLGNEKKEIILKLIDEKDNTYKLRFPDLSGETFQNHYVKRIMSSELANYIEQSDGVLMFINVCNVFDATFINELPACGGHVDENFQGRNPQTDDPTQVQIIELLQFVKIIRKNKITNLGMILSAWDEVMSMYKTPEEYVNKEMNMLWQFIQANRETLKVSFWGVSAQGGRLEDTEKLLQFEEPSDRIIVVNNHGEAKNDITLPIFCVVDGAVNE